MSAPTLGSLLAAGLESELDYMSPDAAAEALDSAEFLASCADDELQDAAEFLALAQTPALF